MSGRASLLAIALAVCLGPLAGCGDGDDAGGPTARTTADRGPDEGPSGSIRVDGPRLFHPLAAAAARNLENETPAEVEVERSGTEEALRELCTGRIAVAGALRRMTSAEREVCEQRDIEFERLKIANHAVAVVTSDELDVRCLTTGQLRELWRPGSTVTRLRQLGAGLPSTTVKLYGPKVGRAGFSLFTQLVNGRAGAIRTEWDAAVNRSALTARLRERRDALAFFNLAELIPLLDAQAVAVDAGEGCVEPTAATVQTGRYPLNEEVYLYVSKPALEKPRVRSFMQYLVEDYGQLVAQAPGLVPASAEEIAEAERRLPEAEIPAG